MVENMIQLTFAEIFVPQDFTIKTTPGLSGLAKTCERVVLDLNSQISQSINLLIHENPYDTF